MSRGSNGASTSEIEKEPREIFCILPALRKTVSPRGFIRRLPNIIFHKLTRRGRCLAPCERVLIGSCRGCNDSGFVRELLYRSKFARRSKEFGRRLKRPRGITRSVIARARARALRARIAQLAEPRIRNYYNYAMKLRYSRNSLQSNLASGVLAKRFQYENADVAKTNLLVSLSLSFRLSVNSSHCTVRLQEEATRARPCRCTTKLPSLPARSRRISRG